MPYDDRARAAAGLRGQLWLLAAADGVRPDWSTLQIEGPTRTTGRHDVPCYEWTATVEVTEHRQGDPGAWTASSSGRPAVRTARHR